MNEGGSFNYGRNPGWKIPSNPFENLPDSHSNPENPLAQEQTSDTQVPPFKH